MHHKLIHNGIINNYSQLHFLKLKPSFIKMLLYHQLITFCIAGFNASSEYIQGSH